MKHDKKLDMKKIDTANVAKTESDWKKELKPEEYHVLREKGTEPAFTGKYYEHKEKGMYTCAACGEPLFNSDTKYESGSGWPSFYAPTSKDAVDEKTDVSHGMKRVEVLCKKCGGHIGHVFDDGPKPTGQRFCINSCALKFRKK